MHHLILISLNRESSKSGSTLDSNVSVSQEQRPNVDVADNQSLCKDSCHSKTSVKQWQQLAVKVIGKRLTESAAKILCQYDPEYIECKMDLAKDKKLDNLDGWLIRHCQENWNNKPYQGGSSSVEKQSHRRNIPRIDPQSGMIVILMAYTESCLYAFENVVVLHSKKLELDIGKTLYGNSLVTFA